MKEADGEPAFWSFLNLAPNQYPADVKNRMGSYMTRSVARHLGFLFLCAALIYLPACATGGRMIVDPEAESVLASLFRCQDAVQTAKGTGKLTIQVEGRGIRKARLVWVAARPSALRLEILGVWGQPLYKLLLKDDTFHLYDIGANKYFHGTAKKHTLKRLLGLGVEPLHLHSILLGCLPVDSFQKAEVSAGEDADDRYLSLYGAWNRLTEKIILDKDSLNGRCAEFFDGWEDLQYIITLNRFREVDGALFPGMIEVSGKNMAVLSLDITKVYLNVPVAEDAFEITSFRDLRAATKAGFR